MLMMSAGAFETMTRIADARVSAFLAAGTLLPLYRAACTRLFSRVYQSSHSGARTMKAMVQWGKGEQQGFFCPGHACRPCMPVFYAASAARSLRLTRPPRRDRRPGPLFLRASTLHPSAPLCSKGEAGAPQPVDRSSDRGCWYMTFSTAAFLFVFRRACATRLLASSAPRR